VLTVGWAGPANITTGRGAGAVTVTKTVVRPLGAGIEAAAEEVTGADGAGAVGLAVVAAGGATSVTAVRPGHAGLTFPIFAALSQST
jgi:hypothetical protein